MGRNRVDRGILPDSVRDGEDSAGLFSRVKAIPAAVRVCSRGSVTGDAIVGLSRVEVDMALKSQRSLSIL
jgi:hypothetical protein